MRMLAIIMLATALAAQTPSAKGLLVDDWRSRNAATAALLKAPPTETHLPTLIAALAKPNLPGGYEVGLYGGRGDMRGPTDPRAAALRNAKELATTRYLGPVQSAAPSKSTLVVPWSSRQLAALVLCDYLERKPDWQRHLTHIAPDTCSAARVWVRCNPSPKAVIEALADARYAGVVQRCSSSRSS